MLENPKFLQGVYNFTGRGLDLPQSFATPVLYKVPFDKRSQMVYFRAGNSSAELIYVVLMRDGKAMRYFPLGAKSATHVPLAVLEDLHPDTLMEVLLAAPTGTSGSLILDIGFTEF